MVIRSGLGGPVGQGGLWQVPRETGTQPWSEGKQSDGATGLPGSPPQGALGELGSVPTSGQALSGDHLLPVQAQAQVLPGLTACHHHPTPHPHPRKMDKTQFKSKPSFNQESERGTDRRQGNRSQSISAPLFWKRPGGSWHPHRCECQGFWSQAKPEWDWFQMVTSRPGHPGDTCEGCCIPRAAADGDPSQASGDGLDLRE